jgi:hypothetical protein
MLVAAGCNSRSSFTTMQADTLVIGPYIFFSSRKEQLGALSLRHAVPAIVAAGGLMSYGGNEAESVWSASTPEKFSKERTRWSARPKVDQDRADNQPQDREDARPHNAALAARYCRRGDRIRPATSGIGPSRHFAAKQHFGCFWREADINRQAEPSGLVANDPQQTFRSVFVWFRNMRRGLLSVSIRGGRPKSEPPAVWMNFAREPAGTLPYLGCWKAMQSLRRKRL